MSRQGASSTLVAPAATSVPPEGRFRRELGLLDASAIVAGSMIGSGIFIVSSDVARTAGSPGWLLMVWVFSALLTILGALSYGELAAMMPRAGGQYVYLREAYSPLLGFLYGWTLFLVIQTGTMAAVAVGFAKYLGVLLPWVSTERTLLDIGPVSFSTQQVIAIGVIALLTWSNSRGLRESKILQNIFTSAKVAALLALILLGLFVARNAETVQVNSTNLWGEQTLSLAFIIALSSTLVSPLFSSDAWNNVTFAASEVKNPRRTLPLSLAGGTGLVMALYCLTNIAYLCLLPLSGSATGVTAVERGMQYATEDRVATAAASIIFGAQAEVIMAVAIMVSTFGCLNGLILAGPRLYYAMAHDKLFFAKTGHLNTAGVPAWGLWFQMIWASLLTLSGSYSNLLDYVIFAALLFYALTVGGLFILRRTRPDAERPYRALGYPWLPGLYVLIASAIMLNLLFVKPAYTWPGLLIVFSGAPVYFFWRRQG